MKKSIIISALLLSFSMSASTYLSTLGEKHYKGSVTIEDYVSPESPTQPEEPTLPVANLENYVFPDGTTSISTYTNTNVNIQVNNGTLPEGYSYWEYSSSKYGMIGVSTAQGLGYSSNAQTSVYCSNGKVYGYGANTGTSCNESARMSILVKQPEGIVWYAKNGAWLRGATSTSIQSGSGFVADYADGSTLIPHAGSGSSGGSSATLIFDPEQWLHYDVLMSWLNN